MLDLRATRPASGHESFPGFRAVGGPAAPLRRSARHRASVRVRAFDRGIDKWAEAHLRGRPVADRVFYGASAVGDHGIIWLILAAALGLRRPDRWRAAMKTAAAIGIESALVNGPVKWVFRRERPERLAPIPLMLRRPRTSSFPSGHATSAFCAAALLSESDPALRPVYYAVALVVAWSRVHVRVHHASDVVGGIAIGIALGRLAKRLFPLPGPARDPVPESGAAARG